MKNKKNTSSLRKSDPNQHPFDFDEMARRWQSPLVARTQSALDLFSGGLLSARTLANLDSLKEGPKGKVKVGRKVAYTVDSLVEWMRERAEPQGSDDEKD